MLSLVLNKASHLSGVRRALRPGGFLLQQTRCHHQAAHQGAAGGDLKPFVDNDLYYHGFKEMRFKRGAI